MSLIREIAMSTAVSVALSCFMVPMAQAEKMHDGAEQSQTVQAPAKFVKKSKSIRGDVRVEQRGDQQVIVFSDSFKARSGPDLKVFLSPQSIKSATGRNATRGAIKLGELKTTKGAQEYVVPKGVDLAAYGSVLVHCEAYSVLWGGAAI
ncbi:MAG: DM13 domain-containing protein [Pseudomonadota bacterium]